MLLKHTILQRILAGEVELAFRCWKRPTVKTGGTLRTAIGELAIDEVSIVSEASLTQDDARRAGYPTLDDLKRDLSRRPQRDLYRVSLRYKGVDRRSQLRDDDNLSDRECAELLERLERLDRHTAIASLSFNLLDLIARWPERRAQELAEEVSMEKLAFKRHVRKLKELGLTESMKTGYRLSARGQRLLAFSKGIERQ